MLDQGAAVAQAHLATLDLRDEPHLLPLAALLARPPHARHQLVARHDGASEARLVFFDVRRVAAAKLAQDGVAGIVPLVQAVRDGALEAHLLARLRRRVKRVVVAVEAVQQRGLGARVVLQHGIGRLALGRREVLRRRALGAVPVALRDEKAARSDAGVDVAAAGVYEVRLGIEDGAGAAFVVDAEHLGARLERLTGRGRGQLLEKLDLALAVDDAAPIEIGYAGNLDGLLGAVEVDDLLGLALERCEQTVSQEESVSSWTVSFLRSTRGYVGKAEKLGWSSWRRNQHE